MNKRTYVVQIPVDVDDKLRELRRAGYLPSVLVRKAIREIVDKKLKDINAGKIG